MIFIKKYYIILIAILIGIIAFNFFTFFIYLHKNSKSLSLMKKTLNEKASKLKITKNEESKIKMNLNALKDNESAIDKLIKDVFKTRSMRLTEAQAGIKGIMKKINLKNKKIVYGFTEHSGKKAEQWHRKYLKMEAGLNLIGGYGDIKKCLHEIEIAPDFLEIEKMELKKTAEGGALTEASLVIATLFENSEVGNPIFTAPEKTAIPNEIPSQTPPIPNLNDSEIKPNSKTEIKKERVNPPPPPQKEIKSQQGEKVITK